MLANKKTSITEPSVMDDPNHDAYYVTVFSTKFEENVDLDEEAIKGAFEKQGWVVNDWPIRQDGSSSSVTFNVQIDAFFYSISTPKGATTADTIGKCITDMYKDGSVEVAGVDCSVFANTSFVYSTEILKRAWPKGEPKIKEHKKLWHRYIGYTDNEMEHIDDILSED